MTDRRLIGVLMFLIAAAAGGMACDAQDTVGGSEVEAGSDSAISMEIPDRLVVATRDVPPFARLNDVGEWEGISIDLLREINVDLESESGHPIELQFESLSLEAMLDAVADGDIDLAVAAITVNHEREKRMDFTHAFYNSGLGIAVGAKQRQSGWTGIAEAIVSPTFLRIVTALLAAMLFCATAIYFFERRHAGSDFQSGFLRGIGAGLWWAAVTLTTVGYGDKVPKTVAGRLIGLVWMFSGLFIVASFTAAVTSALTVNQLRARISGPADLTRVKVATVRGATSENYLRARHIRFEVHEDVESALQSLQDGRCDAVVYDAPILRYYVYNGTVGDLFVLPVTFENQNYAFALQSDSRLREPFNRSLLRHVSSSAWQSTVQGYVGSDEQ